MTGHGVLCACPACERDGLLDDEFGKAITRAAEVDPDYLSDYD